MMLERIKKEVNKYGDDFEFKNPQALSSFLTEIVGKDDKNFLQKIKTYLFILKPSILIH